MKKIITLTLFSVLLFLGTFSVKAQKEYDSTENKQDNSAQAAQATNIEWSTLTKSGKKELVRQLTIICADAQYIYAYYPADSKTPLETELKANELIRYVRATGKLEKIAFNLNGYFEREKRKVEFMTLLGDDIFIFYSEQDRSNKKYFLKGITVNKDNFIANYTPVNILEFDYSKDKGYNKFADFEYKTSPDGAKLLLTYRLKDQEGNICHYGFNVLDDKRRLLWQAENAIPRTLLDGNWFKVGEYTIDNSGNVFLLGSVFSSAKEAIQKPQNNKTVVIAYFSLDKTSKIYPVTLPEKKYIRASAIHVNQNSELVCAGVYSKEKMNSALGVFSMLLDVKSDNAQNVVTKDFTIDLLTEGLSTSDSMKLVKRLVKNKKFEDYDYEVNISANNEGVFQLIVEKFRINAKVKRETNNYQVKSYQYSFGDIIAANLSKDGDFEWIDKIPKKQNIKNSAKMAGSYGLLYGKNNEMCFFYNIMGKKGNKLSKSVLMLTTIDKQGSKKSTELHNTKDSKIQARPSELIDLKNGEIILFGQKGNTASTYAKINLN